MTPYPIKGLTKTQREVFEQIASGNYSLVDYHQFKAFDELVEIGAIELCGEKIICQYKFGTISLPEYRVPLGLHMAWRIWCSDNFDDEVNPKP